MHTVFAGQDAQLVAVHVVVEADGARLEVRALRILLIERAHRQPAQVRWSKTCAPRTATVANRLDNLQYIRLHLRKLLAAQKRVQHDTTTHEMGGAKSFAHIWQPERHMDHL